MGARGRQRLLLAMLRRVRCRMTVSECWRWGWQEAKDEHGREIYGNGDGPKVEYDLRRLEARGLVRRDSTGRTLRWSAKWDVA